MSNIKKEATFDQVHKPLHYNTGEVECIDGIKASLGNTAFISYCQGNSLKYLWRCQYKNNTIQDMEKARWYIDAALKTLKEIQ